MGSVAPFFLEVKRFSGEDINHKAFHLFVEHGEDHEVLLVYPVCPFCRIAEIQSIDWNAWSEAQLSERIDCSSGIIEVKCEDDVEVMGDSAMAMS